MFLFCSPAWPFLSASLLACCGSCLLAPPPAYPRFRHLTLCVLQCAKNSYPARRACCCYLHGWYQPILRSPASREVTCTCSCVLSGFFSSSVSLSVFSFSHDIVWCIFVFLSYWKKLPPKKKGGDGYTGGERLASSGRCLRAPSVCVFVCPCLCAFFVVVACASFLVVLRVSASVIG